MWNKIYSKTEEFLIILILVIMCVVLILQVASRYLFNNPLIWSEEMARYLFVWLTFIGAGYGVKHKIHVSMEVVVKTFQPKIRSIVKILTNLVTIFCYGYIIPSAFKFSLNQHPIDSTAMEIPMSLLYVAVPIGCLIMIIHLLVEIKSILLDLYKMKTKKIVSDQLIQEESC